MTAPAISDLMAARSSRSRVARVSRSALHHMGEGDLWEVFVDPGLATQVQHLPNAPAPPNDQVLVYDLELVEVQGESRSRFHSWHVSSHVEL